MIRPFADAQAAFPFVLAQGRNLETKVYTKRYPSYNYAAIVPVVTEGNPWSIGTTFFTVHVAGQAKFLSGKGTDVPFVSSQRGQASHDFAMIGAGWEWTLEEINQAALYNIDLAATDAMTASTEVERLLYTTAMTGSTEKGWTGFTNDPNVTRYDVEAGGAGGSEKWVDKTSAQIETDFNNLLNSIRQTTSEVEYADTVALPPSGFRFIATQKTGPGDANLTVLEYLRKNNVYTAETQQPLNIVPVRSLATAGVGGVGRMVAYRKDPEVLRFHLPLPRRVLDVRQASLMGYEQGIIARTGGTEIRLPGAVAYADGITAN